MSFCGLDFGTSNSTIGIYKDQAIEMVMLDDNKNYLRSAIFLNNETKHAMFGEKAIEEYIDGRELYVGVLGNERLSVFPPRELFFGEVPEGEPKFATFKAKWDDKYRRRWGIRSGGAKTIADPVANKLEKICKKIYQIFQMKGYGRIDLRLTDEGELYFLEANPNPFIGPKEDFNINECHGCCQAQ